MHWPVALIIIFIVLIAAGAVLRAWARATVAYPYTKNQFLFSPAEYSFLGVLEQAVGREYRVFGKVRMADIVDIQRASIEVIGRRLLTAQCPSTSISCSAQKMTFPLFASSSSTTSLTRLENAESVMPSWSACAMLFPFR
jgi:Protein of unknown function (DUF2726)